MLDLVQRSSVLCAATSCVSPVTSEVSYTMHETPLIEEVSRSSTDHLPLSFTIRLSSSTVNPCKKWVGEIQTAAAHAG